MNKDMVSVVITTKNEEMHIENCLRSVRGQSYPQEKIEIIVVDNNSDDRTAEVSKSFTDKVYNYGPERSAQRNFGISKSSGDYILYLDADMSLSKNVIAECVEKCSEDGDIALFIPEKITGKGFWVRVRDFERSFYNGTVVDCVRFVSREAVLIIGGFDEHLTGPEDWDFDRRIRGVGKTGIISSEIYHNEAGFNLKEYLYKKAYYGRSFHNYIEKWGKSDPVIKKQLGFYYRFIEVFIENGQWLKLLKHPLLAFYMCALRLMVGLCFVVQKKRNQNSKTKFRILILSPFFRPNIGGVENYLYDLCEYLRTHNYMVYVLTYQPLTARIKADSLEVKENMEIRRVSWFGYNLFHRLEPYPLLEFIYLTPCLFLYTFLFMLKNHKKIDVIHAQGLNAAFIVRILAKIFKKRAVMSTCAVYNFNSKSMFTKIVKWALSGMDKILPLANFSKQELERIGLPALKMTPYYLWIDQDKYVPADKAVSKQKVNLAGKFMVLFVGRFIKIKGAEILIKVAKISVREINFVFIGDQGPLLGYIEQESQLRENIILVKGISGEQLIPYYQAADIFVIPSQYDEAFGKVIIEALSCGTPVIGANKGAIPDIIATSVGIVVEPTVENIKSRIDYLYHNPQVLAQLKSNCRAYAESNFSEKNIGVITRSYYQ